MKKFNKLWLMLAGGFLGYMIGSALEMVGETSPGYVWTTGDAVSTILVILSLVFFGYLLKGMLEEQ